MDQLSSKKMLKQPEKFPQSLYEKLNYRKKGQQPLLS